jgi:16S rRNA (uracil1498-N3)-methyltransferase
VTGPEPSGPSGAGGPHAFVADLDRPDLDDHDRHHFERVVRLRAGDALTVSDGRGGWRTCRFGEELEPVDEVMLVARPEPAVTVAFALVKGERPEWVTQKLTELGVDTIVPFTAARSVVRWDDRKAAANRDRLERVAREAAMQSRRCWLPEVAPVSTFAGVAALPGAVRGDRGGVPLTLRAPTVLVGPEGGWTDDERTALPAVGLGVQVLRADTAAVVAGALLTALRAGLVAPAPTRSLQG